MSTTVPSQPRPRRGLGPGVDRALAAAARPPRSPLPWSPAAVDAALEKVLEQHRAVCAPWLEAFAALDADQLAAEAHATGTDPAGAVDRLVRDLIAHLESWERANAALGRALTAAALGQSLPGWAADAGRAQDAARRRARQALLEAVARHHHGGPRPDPDGPRPW